MLPSLGDLTSDVVVTTPAHTVTFRVAPIAGGRWNEIVSGSMSDDGRLEDDDIAGPVLEASVMSYRVDDDPTDQPFTLEDAWTLWNEWPSFYSRPLYQAAVDITLRGPYADSFEVSPPNVRGGG